MLIIFKSLFLLVTIVWAKYNSDVYPKSIPKFEVRRDIYTNKTVVSGLVHTLPQKSKLAEFYKHLQCSKTHPGFNYNNGVISMMRLLPLTSATIKLVCAHIESKCMGWQECQTVQSKCESGEYMKNENFNVLTQWSVAHLYRIVNGQVKMDWPWGMERFETKDISDYIIPLIKMTLDRISDMRDSVFFTGGDTPGLPQDFPVPLFAHATSDPYADIVWPWYEMWQDANRAYKKIRAAKLDFTDAAFEQMEDGYRSWDKKVSKAAYFATNQGLIRQFMFEVARLHPDMFDAGFIEDLIPNWNPMSMEDSMTLEEKKKLAHDAAAVAAAQSLPAGYGEPLANLSSLGGFTRYHPGSYKYVVVPLSAGLSTSGRLQHLLSHTGTVVFIQRSRTKYFIDGMLKPWVHYVPVSYSGADIGEKVRWLREHDDMARQIAENGRNFARSYLRLEDFYCYAAKALDMLADLTGKTDAIKPFNPVDLPPLAIHFGDVAAYEYPV